MSVFTIRGISHSENGHKKTHEYRKNRFVKVPLNTFYILFFVDNNYSTSIQQHAKTISYVLIM